jgi:hypothetical protein
MCYSADADHCQLVKRTAALDVASDRPDKRRRTSDYTEAAVGVSSTAQLAQASQGAVTPQASERVVAQLVSQPAEMQLAMRNATRKEVSTHASTLFVVHTATEVSAAVSVLHRINAAMQLIAPLIELCEVLVIVHTR